MPTHHVLYFLKSLRLEYIKYDSVAGGPMRFFLAHLTHYVAKAIYALLAHFCREKIYALRPESFCAKNSANRKVSTFCVSAVGLSEDLACSTTPLHLH